MVPRLPLLILISLLIILAPGISGAAARGCRGCHPPHYAEQGSCTSCHRGDDRTDRKRIAHYRLIPGRYASFALPGSPAVERGKRLLERFSCRRCHAAGKEGTALAASLDRMGNKTPEELVAALDRPALYMPDFRFAASDRDDLVTYLLRLGTERRGGEKETPVVVHFARKEEGEEHPFVKRCGGCHRALTESLGGVGSGALGPNLSALFTPFYPRPYREGEPWTPERLGEWLRNPRKIRPVTVMPPVPLEQGERERIVGLLTVTRLPTKPPAAGRVSR